MDSRAYDVITDRIIAALDSGVVPWRKPWALAPGQRPHNISSKRPYTGINAVVLGLAGYTDPRFITYRNAAQLGGNVRKAQRGAPVVWWKSYDKPCDPTHPGEVCNRCDPKHPGVRRWWSLGYHTVFNVEQCDGLDLPAIETPEEFDPIDAAETIVAGMPRPPSITHNGADRAFYRPSEDTVHMPPRSAFDGAGEYYATLLHELGHATGHASRLDRHGMETGIAPFGSATYSREELAAEFTAAFLSADAGIENTLDNSAAYIAGWAKAVRQDRKLVVQAASQGQRAADYILGS
jgi:antirestriction protein ArdC